MKGVQANQAAQVRMFAHDAIPVAIGAINPEFGITIDSGGYGYAVGDTIVLNTGTGTGPVAAQLKVKSIGSSSIINVQANGGKFYLDGAQAPAITLNRGETYTFYQKATSNSGHDLEFSLTSGGTALGPSDGVIVTGTAGSSKIVTYTVPSDLSANTIYYQCTTHGASMGAAITIQDSGTDYSYTTTAIKSFEIIRQTGANPFGKAYTVGFQVQPATETYAAPDAFIGKVASIDLASTSDRGACIYVGSKMGTLVVKMESGINATFKNVAAGSFMPVLVKEIITATPDSGAVGDNDIIALY